MDEEREIREDRKKGRSSAKAITVWYRELENQRSINIYEYIFLSIDVVLYSKLRSKSIIKGNVMSPSRSIFLAFRGDVTAMFLLLWPSDWPSLFWWKYESRECMDVCYFYSVFSLSIREQFYEYSKFYINRTAEIWNIHLKHEWLIILTMCILWRV